MRLFLLITSIVVGLAIAACAPSLAPTLVSATPALPNATSAPAATPAQKSTTASTVAATLAPKQTIKVEAFDDFFRPEKITVTVGTQITWTNVGKHDHTVTSGTLFDADIKPGEVFSFTFDKPGTYQYYCVTHSLSDTDGMVGTVYVVAK
jgi:plastocyanin